MARCGPAWHGRPARGRRRCGTGVPPVAGGDVARASRPWAAAMWHGRPARNRDHEQDAHATTFGTFETPRPN